MTSGLELRPQIPAACLHGGAFWEAIGDRFDRLDASQQIVSADVLDAWFPPASEVIDALSAHLAFLIRTSPPTGSEGMIREIARARCVEPECIVAGDGSSSLIFRAFGRWLSPSSRVLLLDPSYGEYQHVLEHVLGARVDNLDLASGRLYDVDLAELADRLEGGYDLVVLVNPNSPTGRHVPRADLERLLELLPDRTLAWIDETYVDYVNPRESLERFACSRPNVIVCKSMSKVYALSGLRAAYLCGKPGLIADLRSITPPWAVSLPAQVAAVAALNAETYYSERYTETHSLRDQLVEDLRSQTDIEVIPGVANFLLCHLPHGGPDAEQVCERCRESGVFLRNASTISPRLGRHALRIAVKERNANQRIVETLASVLGPR